MSDKEIREAIEIFKKAQLEYYAFTGYTPEEYVRAREILLDLATQVIEAKMPQEMKGRFVVEAQNGGHWVMTEEAEGYNQALQDCYLYQQKQNLNKNNKEIK